MSKADKQTILNSSVEMIREYYDKEHKHNKDRIKYGIIAMIIIPIVFLILLFVVNSSKVVFLVMWIASLFIISGYLIAIEYKDYNMTENLKGIINSKDNDALIDTTKVIRDIAMNYVDANKVSDTDESEELYTYNYYNNDNDSNNYDSDYSDDIINDDDNDNINVNVINNNGQPDNNNEDDYINVQAVNDIYNESNKNELPNNNAAVKDKLIENTNNNNNNTIKRPTDHTADNPNDCQNITIDNRINNNTITISIDNKTSAINITINPNKEAGQ